MFGYIVLYGWPVVVRALFSLKTVPVAILGSVIAGYLLLPEQLILDLPLFPDFDKHNIPVIAVFLCLLVIAPNGKGILPGWMPRGGSAKLLVITLGIGAFMTVMTNGDPLVFGPLHLPALRPIDAISTLTAALLTILPLLVARKYLAHPEQHVAFLAILTLAGALYSLLALYEVRMSPQLSNIVYGYFPHSWIQHVRGNGFRPIVFLNHGLWVSIFFACTVLAAAGASRVFGAGKRFVYLGMTLWLLMTLVLSKSLGALMITLVLLPVILFLGIRLQFLIAAAIAFVVLLYPALRGGDLIPVDRAVAFAATVDEARAGSLQFRLDNEDALLARAQERPVFGWGGWGRGAVFDAQGRESSVPDGYWVIIVSVGGWVRYLAEFGLLCVPVILAAFSYQRCRFGVETSVLGLVLIANMIDLIPNATISPLTWLLAGALWGRLELGRVRERDAHSPTEETPSARSAYTRFGAGQPQTEARVARRQTRRA